MNCLVRKDIQTKFTSNVDDADERLKASTVGLVTLDEMKERQKEILQKADDIVTGRADAKLEDKKEQSSISKIESIPQVKSFKRLLFVCHETNCTLQKRVLSFGAFDDDEEAEEEVVMPKKRLGMCPDVETSFLPDKDRERALVQ